jgi:hypothetical protein
MTTNNLQNSNIDISCCDNVVYRKQLTDLLIDSSTTNATASALISVNKRGNLLLLPPNREEAGEKAGGVAL